jgi:hypothetical protein
MPSTTDSRRCPNCGRPLFPGSPCAGCGFDPSAGVIRRDQPHQTHGLNALAHKFGARWSFAAAALIVVVTYMYFDDLTTAEETGGSFTADPFTGLVYAAAGKWAVVAFWLMFVVVFIAAGVRALSLKGSAESR